METTEPFAFKAGDYPEKPGCYLMRDASGVLLYVGKSKSLRSRLRSYFTTRHTRKRLRELVARIASIEIILVNNETESLLLENNLIKIHKPPYNRALKKDNSGYAYLELTGERIPRLAVHYRDRRESAPTPSPESDSVPVRKGAKDAAPEPACEPKRFGPFANARFRTELLEFLADHYKLRSCTVLPKRACLLYHIHKCSGICEGHISEADYAKDVKQLSDLLFGGSKDALIARMYGQMTEYAEQLKFEKAQNMLEHIRNLEKTPEKQIVDRETNLNQEVLYFGSEGVMIAKVQQGMLRDFQLHELERGYAETACDRFLIQRYRAETKPDELIVNRIADPAAVRRALRRPGEGQAPALRITAPKRGLKHALLQLCRENYEYRTTNHSAKEPYHAAEQRNRLIPGLSPIE
ncbi:GIY-YIG nuclease family protein [Paenibacillus sacheonensis]|uniref:GIY-YIG nuclease family protein n=1 Tax=Paenibacillus sacheonensis TaxID=742054 RepID=A0A7X4YSG6_9BACL|nr:GIY-YIG nuclease family protein [Paenibacillus sacheonensis]MBM7569270.1 excinuclease ABC subunit C [Paenibacillus sacheonensis]NBC71720.1 GIY-YIG nuclease family protein [Paenibacillus sacheonensis]